MIKSSHGKILGNINCVKNDSNMEIKTLKYLKLVMSGYNAPWCQKMLKVNLKNLKKLKKLKNMKKMT